VKFFRFVAERLRLLFRGTAAEQRALAMWKAEQRRWRDATTRFIGAALGPAGHHIQGWVATAEGTAVIVPIERGEWLALLDTVYGPEHPLTIAHRRLLMGQGG
jgi:hypothetical protein